MPPGPCCKASTMMQPASPSPSSHPLRMHTATSCSLGKAMELVSHAHLHICTLCCCCRSPEPQASPQAAGARHGSHCSSASACSTLLLRPSWAGYLCHPSCPANQALPGPQQLSPVARQKPLAPSCTAQMELAGPTRLSPAQGCMAVRGRADEGVGLGLDGLGSCTRCVLS